MGSNMVMTWYNIQNQNKNTVSYIIALSNVYKFWYINNKLHYYIIQSYQ